MMYPWATPDYVLTKMSLAQIAFYHTQGLKWKFGMLSDTSKTQEKREPQRTPSLFEIFGVDKSMLKRVRKTG